MQCFESNTFAFFKIISLLKYKTIKKKLKMKFILWVGGELYRCLPTNLEVNKNN